MSLNMYTVSPERIVTVMLGNVCDFKTPVKPSNHNIPSTRMSGSTSVHRYDLSSKMRQNYCLTWYPVTCSFAVQPSTLPCKNCRNWTMSRHRGAKHGTEKKSEHLGSLSFFKPRCSSLICSILSSSFKSPLHSTVVFKSPPPPCPPRF